MGFLSRLFGREEEPRAPEPHLDPARYRSEVLPRIVDGLRGRCLCTNEGLRKLVSFNFEDYRISPVGCADSEILIATLFQENGDVYESIVDQGMVTLRCRICARELKVVWSDFSISMNRTYIYWPEKKPREALVMIGFFGFDLEKLRKVRDFRMTDDVTRYLQSLGAV